MIKQRTLKKIIQISGIGLHSGKKIKLIFYPVPENTGIVYRRVDLKPPVDFLIKPKCFYDTFLKTCLISNKNNVRIFTIEHLNAALSGLGIDNIIIEINSYEIPIMDGSAMPFVFLFLDAGIKELNSAKKFLYVKKTVKVKEKDKWAKLDPYNGFLLDFVIDFNHPVINKTNKHFKLKFSSKSFINDISYARTFGFLKDIKKLKSNGFYLGGSFDCAIVVGDNYILNKNKLRFKDEFVRHKILDAIGDLFMCGYNIIGSFSAYKSGHKLNNKLLKTILKNKTAWSIIEFDKKCDFYDIFKIPSKIKKPNF